MRRLSSVAARLRDHRKPRTHRGQVRSGQVSLSKSDGEACLGVCCYARVPGVATTMPFGIVTAGSSWEGTERGRWQQRCEVGVQRSPRANETQRSAGLEWPRSLPTHAAGGFTSWNGAARRCSVQPAAANSGTVQTQAVVSSSLGLLIIIQAQAPKTGRGGQKGTPSNDRAAQALDFGRCRGELLLIGLGNLAGPSCRGPLGAYSPGG